MGIGQAVEVVKILKPYTDKLRKKTDALQMLKTLMDEVQEINPVDSMRMVALMYRTPVASLMEKFGDPEKSGPLLLRALIQGFAVNPLPDLVNMGTMFGLLEEGWTRNAGPTD